MGKKSDEVMGTVRFKIRMRNPISYALKAERNKEL